MSDMTRTILITGASSGIGRETAKYFQAKDWNVVATMRSPHDGSELAELDKVLVTRLDVQDSASIEQAVAEGIERFGAIDVLLNNAGYGAYGLLEATPVAKIRRQFDVNVVGLLETTKAVLPHFRKKGEGVIINVSSMGGKVAFPLGTLYHGSKFAVEGLSEALSYEMAAIGVKVKLVEPGMIATDFGGRSLDVSNDEAMAEYQELVGQVFAGFQSADRMMSAPIVVAEAIYEAATDGTDQLRYTAGEDARMIIAARETQDDATFMQGMRDQMGL
jgi:NAD(P)-dependent dehydrogenase (short-subunit alcohol dehydrogenase family)